MLTKENAQKLRSDYQYLIGKELDGYKIYDIETLNEGAGEYTVRVLIHLKARVARFAKYYASIFYALDKLEIDIDYNQYGIKT